MLLSNVSGFALEWIEMIKFMVSPPLFPVSGFALEWIEIFHWLP